MIDKEIVKDAIIEATNDIHFETVASLSKDEFIEVLSSAISGVMNSSAFSESVSEDMASRSVRRSRGRL